MVSKRDVKKTLTAYLRQLHLPTFRESFEELAHRAVQETLSYEQYLLELSERECQVREANRIERMLRQSRLPLEKDLPSFDLKRLPTKVSRQVRTLLEGSFVDRCENLLVFGKRGEKREWGVSRVAGDALEARGALRTIDRFNRGNPIGQLRPTFVTEVPRQE